MILRIVTERHFPRAFRQTLIQGLVAMHKSNNNMRLAAHIAKLLLADQVVTEDRFNNEDYVISTYELIDDDK